MKGAPNYYSISTPLVFREGSFSDQEGERVYFSSSRGGGTRVVDSTRENKSQVERQLSELLRVQLSHSASPSKPSDISLLTQ